MSRHRYAVKLFNVEELVVPAIFPRTTALSTQCATDRLSLACKLYRPKGLDKPDATQPSVFFVNGNGFPKESYEPMFESFYSEMKAKHGISLNYILAMEPVNQGHSAVLNEDKLGNDMLWTDAWRDVVAVHYYLMLQDHPIINTPLIGIGHSFGGNVILGASTINREMFKAVLSIDGVIGRPFSVNEVSPFLASFNRRDRWPSREAAAESLARSKFYGRWDPRACDNYVTHGLRDQPTLLYPAARAPEVTLACPVAQELSTFQSIPEEEDPDLAALKRDCPLECLRALQHTRVPTHMLLSEIGLGERDTYAHYLTQQDDAVAPGRRLVTFEELDKSATHSVPFEKPELVAGVMAKYFGRVVPAQLARDQALEARARYLREHPVHRAKYDSVMQLINEKKEKTAKI